MKCSRLHIESFKEQLAKDMDRYYYIYAKHIRRFFHQVLHLTRLFQEDRPTWVYTRETWCLDKRAIGIRTHIQTSSYLYHLKKF